uniref:NADH-ubiquinone oxidoreductase chain 6 n=1 Tax=Ophiothrix sp. TaxID=2909811 RepID=A0AAU6QD93_9ECHI
MVLIICVSFLCGALILVFSQTPFYSLFGVLLVSISHSFLIAFLGAPFYSGLLLIIYAGGMLVVFLFSTILSADRFFIFSRSYFTPSVLGVLLFLLPIMGSPSNLSGADNEFGRGGWEILSAFYNLSGFILCVVGAALLVCLVGVLQVSFEHGRKQLRRL